MPRDEFFEKKNEQKEHTFQVETSLEETTKLIHEDQIENRRIGEENYDETALSAENERIMGRLEDRGLFSGISEDMRERLRAQDMTRLTRNNAILLYGDKRDSEDSDLMQNIKRGLKDLDDILRIPMKEGPEPVYEKYETLIGLMGTYVGSKHPLFPDGKRRKAKTAELLDNLKSEYARFKAVIREQSAGVGGLPQEMRVPMDVLEGRYLILDETAELSGKLDERKLELFSLKHKNGDADGRDMKAIKDEFTRLTGLLEGEVEEDKKALSKKKQTLLGSYENLIRFCDDYIRSHNPLSAEGKRRLREVKELRERSQLESDYIGKIADTMVRTKDHPVTWKEVFGQVSIMADECILAKKKTEVLLGEHPKATKILDVFESMTLMSEAHPYRYMMLPEVVMTDWLEKHFDKDMADEIVTERFRAMDEIAKKYREILKNPVPKEFLKNPDDDPMDIEIRRSYARLMMTSEPAFKAFRMTNRLGTTLEFGVDKDKSHFKNDKINPGEYYMNLGVDRKIAMSETEKAYIDEIGGIATRISDRRYKNLNADAVKDRNENVNKADFIQSQRNLKQVMSKTAKARYLEFDDPETERDNITATMNVVAGKAYMPVQRPADRLGTWSRIKNRLMVGYRFMVGSTIGTLASLVLNSYQGAKKLLYEGKEKGKAQEVRRHDLVPGRKGELFEDEIVKKDENGEDTEVYSDVRRGPLVFEKLSAGDPEDPPEVIVMSNQAKRGDTAAQADGPSHAFIGLSYSRYNKMTGRKERYQLRIGFFQGGGLKTETGLAAIGGAMIAGQIRSDYYNDYDVARRYQVKPGDINKILRAAEKYADKGYGMYKRNCSTFMVEMSKLIDLPIAKDFKETEMKFNGAAGVKAETAIAMSKAGYYMGANAISKRMNKMDLSYQNFGQKLFTKEDLKRYYKTAGTADAIKKGYDPGAVGETIRNAKSGELTAKYQEHEDIDNKKINDAISDAGMELWNKIEKRLPSGIRTERDVDLHMALTMLGDCGLSKLTNKSSTSSVRGVYKGIRAIMKKLNAYYAEVLGSDASLNMDVMNLLSLYESALSMADEAYQKLIGKDAIGDAGRLRADFVKKEYQVNFKGQDGNTVRTKISPGIFEGYLMMGKTPEQAVKEQYRFNELDKRYDNLTEKEKKEWTRLAKTSSLAEDFASANRYLLEKEDYSDKDISYAFSELPAMEKAVKENESIWGDLVTTSGASNTYQGVILEHVFGGFQKLKLGDINDNNKLKQIIDDYTEGCLNQNRDMADRILKAFIQGKKDTTTALAENFMDIIGYACIQPACGNVFGVTGSADANSLSELMMGDSKLKQWLTTEIDSIRNAGGESK